MAKVTDFMGVLSSVVSEPTHASKAPMAEPLKYRMLNFLKSGEKKQKQKVLDDFVVVVRDSDSLDLFKKDIKAPAGAYFVENEKERQSVLNHYRQIQHPGSVVHITKPTDFDKDHLVRTVTCKPDQPLETGPGRLYGDLPLTVVIDFPELNAAQTASLNELFDTPPRYQGRLLGPNVTIVGLMESKMLENRPGVPGPDFHRRMDSLGVMESPEPTDQDLTDEAVLSVTDLGSEEQEVQPNPETSRELDFFKQKGSWQSLLLGGIRLSDKGTLGFESGVVVALAEATETLILTNAPWDDPDFTRTLATAKREGGFWANNEWIVWPENLKLASKKTSRASLQERLKEIPVGSSDHPYVCINEECFDRLMSDITFEGGQLRGANSFANLIDGRDPCSIMVSGPLKEHQWVQLIARLEGINPRPGLMLAVGTRPPAGLGLDARLTEPKVCEGVVVKTESEIEDRETGAVFEYHVTSKTDPNTLLCSLPLVSQLSMTFREEFSPLMEALQQGDKVRIHGLHTNPEVAQLLESLVSPNPYVFLNGRRVDLPKLQCECVTLPSAKLPGLWKSQKGQTEVARLSNDELIEQVAKEQDVDVELLKKVANLLNSVRTLPRSRGRRYPDSPHPLNRELLTKVIRQVRFEQSNDCSDRLRAYHWQKAMNDVVAKEYRGDASAYAFVKAMIAQQYPEKRVSFSHRVDIHGVRSWLQAHPAVTPETFKKHYWELARCFTADVLPDVSHFDVNSPEAVNRLMSMVVQCVPAHHRKALTNQLRCRVLEPVPLQYVDGQLLSLVYNALIGVDRKHRQYSDKSVYLQADLFMAALCKPGVLQSTERVRQMLAKILKPEILAGDYNDLADAIVQRKGSRYRQKRRIQRLLGKIKDNPMVMLKGEAGTGKTYTAEAVGQAYSDYQNYSEKQPPMVYSLSPEHTQDELFGTQKLIANPVTLRKQELSFSTAQDSLWATLCELSQTPFNSDSLTISFSKGNCKLLKQKMGKDRESDCFEVISRFQDNHTELEPGPILKWAEMEEPPVLILDEANLVKLGVLQSLQGLNRKPPEISIMGRVIKLTDKHRIIMTGNPEYYDGRIVDPVLRKNTLTLYYRPFKESILAETIVEPAIPGEWPEALREYAVSTVSELYGRYRQVLPGHAFSPRDIKDILARVKDYCGDKSPSKEQFNAVLWQSTLECLEGEIEKGQAREARALEHWFQTKFPSHKDLVEVRDQQYENFYQAWRAARDPKDFFDYDTPAVKSLAKSVWQELEKTGGKSAMVIEGEAGRGKDVLLDRLLPFWLASKNRKPEFERINASPENWEELKEMAARAMKNGTLLVISELNTMPSRYIEGLFNEVLGGIPAPGFHLIATINPSDYSGREASSEALKSRCVQKRLVGFQESELRGIVGRRYKKQKKFTDWLVSEHWQLARKLDNCKSPVRLPLAKLIDAAKKIKDLPRSQWQARFNKEYRLALKAVEHAGKGSLSAVKVDEGRIAREKSLCDFVNQRSYQPVTVILEGEKSRPVYDEGNRILRLPDLGKRRSLETLAMSTLDSQKKNTGWEAGLSALAEESQLHVRPLLPTEVSSSGGAAKKPAKDTGSSVDSPTVATPGSQLMDIGTKVPDKAQKEAQASSLLDFSSEVLSPEDMSKALKKSDPALLANLMREVNPEKTAELMSKHFSPEDKARLLREGSPEMKAAFMEQLSPEQKQALYNTSGSDGFEKMIQSIPQEQMASALMKVDKDLLAPEVQKHLSPEDLAGLTGFDSVAEFQKALAGGDQVNPESVSKLSQALTYASQRQKAQLAKQLPVEKFEQLTGTTVDEVDDASLAEVMDQVEDSELAMQLATHLSPEQVNQTVSQLSKTPEFPVNQQAMARLTQTLDGASSEQKAELAGMLTPDALQALVGAPTQGGSDFNLSEALGKVENQALAQQWLKHVPEQKQARAVHEVSKFAGPRVSDEEKLRLSGRLGRATPDQKAELARLLPKMPLEDLVGEIPDSGSMPNLPEAIDGVDVPQFAEHLLKHVPTGDLEQALKQEQFSDLPVNPQTLQTYSEILDKATPQQKAMLSRQLPPGSVEMLTKGGGQPQSDTELYHAVGQVEPSRLAEELLKKVPQSQLQPAMDQVEREQKLARPRVSGEEVARLASKLGRATTDQKATLAEMLPKESLNELVGQEAGSKMDLSEAMDDIEAPRLAEKLLENIPHYDLEQALEQAQLGDFPVSHQAMQKLSETLAKTTSEQKAMLARQLPSDSLEKLTGPGSPLDSAMDLSRAMDQVDLPKMAEELLKKVPEPQLKQVLDQVTLQQEEKASLEDEQQAKEPPKKSRGWFSGVKSMLAKAPAAAFSYMPNSMKASLIKQALKANLPRDAAGHIPEEISAELNKLITPELMQQVTKDMSASELQGMMEKMADAGKGQKDQSRRPDMSNLMTPELVGTLMDKLTDPALKSVLEQFSQPGPSKGATPSPNDNMASMLEKLTPQQKVRLMEHLPAKTQSDLFSNLSGEDHSELMSQVPDEVVTQMLKSAPTELLSSAVDQMPDQLNQAMMSQVSAEQLSEMMKKVPAKASAEVLGKMKSHELSSAIRRQTDGQVSDVTKHVTRGGIQRGMEHLSGHQIASMMESSNLSPDLMEEIAGQLPPEKLRELTEQRPDLQSRLDEEYGSKQSKGWFGSFKSGLSNAAKLAGGALAAAGGGIVYAMSKVMDVDSAVRLGNSGGVNNSESVVARVFKKDLSRSGLNSEFIKELLIQINGALDLDLGVNMYFGPYAKSSVWSSLGRVFKEKSEGRQGEYEEAQIVRLVDLFCRNSVREVRLEKGSKEKEADYTKRVDRFTRYRKDSFTNTCWQLASTLHHQFQQGRLSRASYAKILGSMVFDFNAIPPSTVIGFLKVLEGDPDYGHKAELAMNHYYEEALQEREIPPELKRYYHENTYQARVLEGKRYKIPYLEKMMRTRSLDKEFKETPTGEGPDSNRLSVRLPAFPVKASSSDRITIVWPVNADELRRMLFSVAQELYPVDITRYVSHQHEHDRSCFMKGLLIAFEKAMRDYGDEADWKLMLQAPTYVDHLTYGEPLSPGIYGMELAGYMVADAASRNGDQGTAEILTKRSFSQRSRFVGSADPARVLEAIDKPNAVYLDPPRMEECLRDFVSNISPDEFLEIERLGRENRSSHTD